MTTTQSTDSSPGLPRISVNAALAGWHEMLCCPAADQNIQQLNYSKTHCNFLDSEISASIGSGNVDLISFDDEFLLMSMRGQFHDHLNYKIMGEGWTRLHFRKSARSSMNFDGLGQSEFEGPLCQILHQPNGMEDEEWIQRQTHLEWVTLCVRPELLVNRFKLDSQRLSDPVRRLANGSDDFLLKNWSLSPEMILAISQLLDSPYCGDLKRIHLEAKAIELICMMSDVMTVRSSRELAVKLSTNDIDRLHSARELLSRTYANPPSIATLSRNLGINRNKLSYGFKHLFDMTISAFCARCRLQDAHDLLINSQLPIAIIANQVGYQQAAAFTAAFKRQFGQTPREIRKHQPVQGMPLRLK